MTSAEFKTYQAAGTLLDDALIMIIQSSAECRIKPFVLIAN